MSAPRPPVTLTPEARTDLRGILLYSRREWGKRQRDAYRAAIYRAFETIRAYPEAGRQRDELRKGRRSHPVRQHIIIYRIDGDRVIVLRILHGRMDNASQLGAEDDEEPRP